MPYSIDSSSDRCYPGTNYLINKFDIHDAQKLGQHLDLAATNPDELMIATIYAAQGVMDYLIDCFDGALQMPEINSGIGMHLL